MTTIPACYHLKETPRKDYRQRTEWNVRDSDATVVFTMASELTGGSKRALQFAQQHGRPVLHLTATRGVAAAAEALRSFLAHNPVKNLNLAGSRASKEPEVGRFVGTVLDGLLPG